MYAELSCDIIAYNGKAAAFYFQSKESRQHGEARTSINELGSSPGK